VSRQGVITATVLAVCAVSAPAATAPPTRTPQDAVAIVKRIVVRHSKPCHLDWARIDAEGYKGNWNIDVKIRRSRSGKGIARWHIGKSWPFASNRLATAITHDCKKTKPAG
jgi:hypothetical protein